MHVEIGCVGTHVCKLVFGTVNGTTKQPGMGGIGPNEIEVSLACPPYLEFSSRKKFSRTFFTCSGIESNFTIFDMFMYTNLFCHHVSRKI